MSKKILAMLTEIAKIAEGKSIEEINVGLLSAKQKRNLKKAVKLLKQKTKGEDPLGSLSLWLQIVMITLKLEWVDEAIFFLRLVLRHNPTEDRAWNKLAKLLEFQRRYKEAEDVYRTVLHHDPTSVISWQLLGGFYWRQKRYSEAEESIRTGLHHDPTHTISWESLGGLLFSLQKYEEAEECFRAVLNYDPTNGETWLFLGTILYCMKKYEKSLESLNQAKSFAPPDDDSFMPKVDKAITRVKQELN
jgi:tetratricopeptide (TPR) repeat protein